jgi:hypothetical protein
VVVIYTLFRIFGSSEFRKYCAAQDRAGFGKVSPAKRANGLGIWGISN